MSHEDGRDVAGTEGAAGVYTFGEYIRRLRKGKGWALKDAAKRMSMPTQKLCDIESGRRHHKQVSIELVQAISNAYGIPIADVFSHVRTTLHVKETTEEVLAELLPLVRITDMLSEKLKNLTSTYPPELEELSTEVHGNVKKIQMLVRLIQNRNVVIESKKMMGD